VEIRGDSFNMMGRRGSGEKVYHGSKKDRLREASSR
jgi:hypothetical protein